MRLSSYKKLDNIKKFFKKESLYHEPLLQFMIDQELHANMEGVLALKQSQMQRIKLINILFLIT